MKSVVPSECTGSKQFCCGDHNDEIDSSFELYGCVSDFEPQTTTGPSERQAPAERAGSRGRLLKRLPLLLIPSLVVLAYVVIKDASGPYFLSGNFDPDYAYLVNALNVAIGRSPQHIDHPGTPIHLLGAALIRLGNLGEGQLQMATTVLSESEVVLDRINLILFGILFLVLVAGGILLFKKTGQLASALLFQSAIAFLGPSVYCLARANPEPALLIVSLLLGLVIYLVGHARPAPWWFVVVAALLCATGLAAKLTFLPLVMLPLLVIREWPRRGLFLLLFAIFLALWLVPIFNSLGRFFEWVAALAIRKGRYGSGELGLFDWSSYGHNLAQITSANLAFVGLMAASFLFALWLNFGRREALPDRRRGARLLLAVAACQLAQFVVVCKYQEGHYLVPAIGLAGLNLMLLHDVLDGRRARWIFYVGLIVLAVNGLWKANGKIATLRARAAESQEVARVVTASFPDSVRVYCYGASSIYYALYFGNSFAGEIYGPLLHRLNREPTRIYFYNNFRSSYHTFAGPIAVEEVLRQPGPVLYQSRPFGGSDPIYAWPAGVKLQRVGGANAEALYRVERPGQ